MAKLVPDDTNRFRRAWQHTQAQGVGRQVMSDSLGIDRGRLNDLILGRARPSLGETSALTGRRPSSLIRYRDASGVTRGMYTGRGASYESLFDTSGGRDEIMDVLEDSVEQTNSGDDPVEILAIVPRAPSSPTGIRVWSMSKSVREQLRK